MFIIICDVIYVKTSFAQHQRIAIYTRSIVILVTLPILAMLVINIQSSRQTNHLSVLSMFVVHLYITTIEINRVNLIAIIKTVQILNNVLNTNSSSGIANFNNWVYITYFDYNYNF